MKFLQRLLSIFRPRTSTFPPAVIVRADRDAQLDITRALKSDPEADNTRWN